MEDFGEAISHLCRHSPCDIQIPGSTFRTRHPATADGQIRSSGFSFEVYQHWEQACDVFPPGLSTKTAHLDGHAGLLWPRCIASKPATPKAMKRFEAWE